jgi:hypothetical protein
MLGGMLVRTYGPMGDHQSDRRNAECYEEPIVIHAFMLRGPRLAPGCSDQSVQSQATVKTVFPNRRAGALATPKLAAVMGVTKPMTT